MASKPLSQKPEKRGRGRPPLLTDENRKDIINGLRAGNYLETCCNFVGVDIRTVRRWLKLGKTAYPRAKGLGQLYRTFFLAVRRAVAEAEMRDLASIDRAGKKDWRAKAWRLQHRHPRNWGTRSTLELEAKGPGVRMGIVQITAEELGKMGNVEIVNDGVDALPAGPSTEDKQER